MKIYFIPSKRTIKKRIEDREISQRLLDDKMIRRDKAPDGGKVFPFIIGIYKGEYEIISVDSEIEEYKDVQEGIAIANDVIKQLSNKFEELSL